MNEEKLIHDWIVSHLRRKLSRDYKEININLEGEKENEFRGHYPDLILGNHGLVLAIVEVETQGSITTEKAQQWKELSKGGVKLIVMVPKALKAKAVELLWENSIADKVAVGSYEINISMP